MSTNERDLIVGGQAVIEGVMMRTPNAYAIAVRKADGTIVNVAARLPKWSVKYPILKLPVLRGSAMLVQSMGLGIKARTFGNEASAMPEARQGSSRCANAGRVIEENALAPDWRRSLSHYVPTQSAPKTKMKPVGTAAAAVGQGGTINNLRR